MSSIVETIQKRTPLLPSKQQSLPISNPAEETQPQPGLRRRLSSLSLKLHPISASPAASWAIHRSKSLSSIGENAIKKWWDLGWAWILSKKPIFAQDLEMNEEEKHVLGFQNRGSFRHIFYKVKSEIRKIFRYDDDMSLPQTFRYNSCNDYSKNFNGGFKRSATLG